MDRGTALRLAVATIVGLMLIAAGITGKAGSILGALIDANNMVEGKQTIAVGEF